MATTDAEGHMCPSDLLPEAAGDVRSALGSSKVRSLSHALKDTLDHPRDTLPGICPQDLTEIMIPLTAAHLTTDGFTSN